jgi:hypothetical protein
VLIELRGFLDNLVVEADHGVVKFPEAVVLLGDLKFTLEVVREEEGGGEGGERREGRGEGRRGGRERRERGEGRGEGKEEGGRRKEKEEKGGEGSKVRTYDFPRRQVTHVLARHSTDHYLKEK